ncbi:MAG: hypothetical protein U0O42_10265 [Oscillospiraceae bacterium]|jgi:uncharacterized protein YukE|nr:hypothetical protein [Oscillospiraceae bacterium]
MANIAWNGDELQTITNNINECLKLLQVQQAHLEKLQAQTQDGWNSEAGRIYAERIEGDLAEIRQSVDLFSSAVNRLQQARASYAQAEDDMQHALLNLCI